MNQKHDIVIHLLIVWRQIIPLWETGKLKEKYFTGLKMID